MIIIENNLPETKNVLNDILTQIVSIQCTTHVLLNFSQLT